jgi:acyl carrier protein
LGKGEAGLSARNPRSEEEIVGWLLSRVAAQTGIRADELELDVPVSSYGLSSRDAVAMSGELEEWLQRTLPPTLLWEYPTVRTLAQFLAASA